MPAHNTPANPATITIVRIYLSETDKIDHHNLMNEIFSRLHDVHKIHGVTVFRGVAGFGDHGQVHSTDLLRIQANLPLVIEFFDEPGVVDAVMEWIVPLVSPGHIVTFPAEVR